MENQTEFNGFVFQRSYYESLKDLDDCDRLELNDAIQKLVFENIQPTFTKKYLNSCFKLIEPTLAASLSRYKNSIENGKKGGRKPSKSEPSKSEPSKAEEKKPIIEEQTINDDIDNIKIQGIEIDEETEVETKEPYENFSMDDSKIPVELLFDYYNTVDFNNQLKRVNVYNMIENGEIKTKQEILEYATF